MRIFATVIFFLISPAVTAFASDEPFVRAPYRIDYGGWFTVSVTIDGQGPYDFIIDTGSSQTFVFENLAREKSFPPSGGPDRTILGMSATAKFPTYVVGDIAFGKAILENAWCVVLQDWLVDDKSPHGVIGLDMLSSYKLVFDVARQEVLLFKADASPQERFAQWAATPLQADDFGLNAGELYTVIGTVERKPVRFLVDLGASGTIINRAAATGVAQGNEFRLSLAPRLSTTPIGQVVDALDEEVETQTIMVRRFRIGTTSWSRKLLILHNAQLFTEIGVADKPFGLLGADMLRDRSFAIDFPNQQLLIGPKGGEKS